MKVFKSILSSFLLIVLALMNCFESSHLRGPNYNTLAPCPPPQFLVCPLPGINGLPRIPPPCPPCQANTRCCFDGCFFSCRPYPLRPYYNYHSKGGCSKCRGKK
ncbi:hypothetical protein Anas_11026 [Armadillidium nasatum]|uniref:WAP domain-containing protein n=1 Tax=Armadillidium nasatum TaxID=96803 RepID=A0A5N5T6Z3_9CRUS|nr:hypothetical protein Anas_11026 [Armadillidium nasatum]